MYTEYTRCGESIRSLSCDEISTSMHIELDSKVGYSHVYGIHQMWGIYLKL
jgi:hypothetical protein